MEIIKTRHKKIIQRKCVCVVRVCECCARVCICVCVLLVCVWMLCARVHERDFKTQNWLIRYNLHHTRLPSTTTLSLSSTRTHTHFRNTRTFSFSFFQWHTFSWTRVNQHSTHTLAFPLKTKERFLILSHSLSFRVSTSLSFSLSLFLSLRVFTSLFLSFLTWDNNFLFPRVSQFQRKVDPNRRRRRFFA